MNNENYWFRAKKIGWGWGLPCAWQGWVVLVAFVGVSSISAVAIAPGHLLAWIGCMVLMGFVLVAICWAKGERPGRR